MKSIVHIFPNFTVGGAENQAIKLMNSSTSHRHTLIIIGNKVDSELLAKIADGVDVKIIRFNVFNFIQILWSLKAAKGLQIVNWLYPTIFVSLLVHYISNSNRLILCLRNHDCRISSIGIVNVINLFFLKFPFRTKIVVISNSFASLKSHEFFIQKYKKFVVGNIYSESNFNIRKPRKHMETIKVAYVSRNSFLKGVDFFLDLVNLSRIENRKRVEFSVYGVGLDQDWLRKSFHEGYIGSLVNAKRSYGSFEDIADLYDCFVITSRAESQPNVFFECILANIPVFSFDVGDLRRVLGEELSDHFICDCYDVSGLYNKMIDWYELDTNDQLRLLNSAEQKCREYFKTLDAFDEILEVESA